MKKFAIFGILVMVILGVKGVEAKTNLKPAPGGDFNHAVCVYAESDNEEVVNFKFLIGVNQVIETSRCVLLDRVGMYTIRVVGVNKERRIVKDEEDSGEYKIFGAKVTSDTFLRPLDRKYYSRLLSNADTKKGGIQLCPGPAGEWKKEKDGIWSYYCKSDGKPLFSLPREAFTMEGVVREDTLRALVEKSLVTREDLDSVVERLRKELEAARLSQEDERFEEVEPGQYRETLKVRWCKKFAMKGGKVECIETATEKIDVVKTTERKVRFKLMPETDLSLISGLGSSVGLRLGFRFGFGEKIPVGLEMGLGYGIGGKEKQKVVHNIPLFIQVVLPANSWLMVITGFEAIIRKAETNGELYAGKAGLEIWVWRGLFFEVSGGAGKLKIRGQPDKNDGWFARLGIGYGFF
jgi:hypothetical protein